MIAQERRAYHRHALVDIFETANPTVFSRCLDSLAGRAFLYIEREAYFEYHLVPTLPTHYILHIRAVEDGVADILTLSGTREYSESFGSNEEIRDNYRVEDDMPIYLFHGHLIFMEGLSWKEGGLWRYKVNTLLIGRRMHREARGPFDDNNILLSVAYHVGFYFTSPAELTADLVAADVTLEKAALVAQAHAEYGLGGQRNYHLYSLSVEGNFKKWLEKFEIGYENA